MLANMTDADIDALVARNYTGWKGRGSKAVSCPVTRADFDAARAELLDSFDKTLAGTNESTTDHVYEPLTVNGETRQKGSTKTMIFGVEHLVWYCSQFFIMEPGDIIATGTPPGVALGMKPQPKFLNAGDVVRLGIEGLGEQQQKIVPSR